MAVVTITISDSEDESSVSIRTQGFPDDIRVDSNLSPAQKLGLIILAQIKKMIDEELKL